MYINMEDLNMKKSTVMMLIAVILSVIAISSGIVFFSQMADENKAEQTYENLSCLSLLQ